MTREVKDAGTVIEGCWNYARSHARGLDAQRGKKIAVWVKTQGGVGAVAVEGTRKL